MIMMDGKQITKLELVGSDGDTVTKTLTESGTIVTPTATLNKTVTANGEQTIDVTNYKYIKITTNVTTEGGGDTEPDTPVVPDEPEPTDTYDYKTGSKFKITLTSDGLEADSSSATTSDYLDILSYSGLDITVDSTATTDLNLLVCWWYDENKNPLYMFTNTSPNEDRPIYTPSKLIIGETQAVGKPSGAKYFRICGKTTQNWNHLTIKGVA